MNVSKVFLINCAICSDLLKWGDIAELLNKNFFIIAEGICSDDIFGIHTELKLPPQKNNLGLDEDGTELESVSGMFQIYLHIITVIKISIIHQKFDYLYNRF